MLRKSIDAFLTLRRAAGFQLKDEGRLLHHFAQWASDHGETHVRTSAATEWAAMGPTPWQRERRLRVIAGFARHVRVEDSQHQIPSIFVFGRRHVLPRPYIYSPEQLQRLMNAASRLAPTWPLRAQVFTTLVGVLASTGLRISEALALRFGDVTRDGLIIRKTKFNKNRLVPLHPTASSALERYLAIRQRGRVKSDYVFISPNGRKLPYGTLRKTFRHLLKETAIRPVVQKPGPFIHSFRHTFAVRALETSLEEHGTVGWRVRALSTYLGHARVSDTCWYLHVTPELMHGVADACQRFMEGGAQ